MEIEVQEVARSLLEKANRAVQELDLRATTVKEKYKEDGRDTQREYTLYEPGGVVDTGTLKQLASALKDLQAVLDGEAEAMTVQIIADEALQE